MSTDLNILQLKNKLVSWTTLFLHYLLYYLGQVLVATIHTVYTLCHLLKVLPVK